ncbi:MAG: hypothetical protein KDA75_07040 [Planctomycetaceae bacterium]|nr:hypothetical protein [Planctomycetaceae bacterium]
MPRRRLTVAMLVAFLAVVPALSGRGEERPPHDFAKWESAIQAFEAADQANPPKTGGVLFVGSSTMRMWKTNDLLPDLHVINRGFGGSEMIDTLHFADRIVIPYQPRVMLLYAGSNDLGHNEQPCAIAARFEELIAKVHAASPETEIVFMSVKPTVKRWALIHRIRATNALVEAVCVDHEHVHYLDAHTPMLNADGEPDEQWLSSDGLHLNDAGYKHLTEVVRPVVDRLLAVKPVE